MVKNASVKREGSDLLVKWRDKSVTVSVADLELVIIIGSNVNMSSEVLLFLSSQNVPVAIHGKYSDVVLVSPFMNSMSDVRSKQYCMSEDRKIILAKRFIEGKVRGMFNVAKYFGYLNQIEVKVEELDLRGVNDLNSLRLIEAEYGRKAWDELKKFLPREFTGRKPRNEDPINRAIDYAYSIIYSLCTHALIAVGLDPYAGVMHSNFPGRLSFTYDFSEMFKSVAVHVVISSSRRVKLSLDKKGYLSKESAEYITKYLYTILRKKKVRSAIYRLAYKVRKFVTDLVDFEPFIYKPKG
ncbi:CRISPR-associated endonuclease Cas1 [Saccharolobus islandicus]|nr:CRISPR-associated endonuclease Cas1 [Sulfolobus islandicus]